MNTINIVKQDHDLEDVLELWRKKILFNFNCHAIGTIQTFDPDTQTCTATLNYKKTMMVKSETGYVAQLVEYPIITDAPVYIYKGGVASIRLPIKPKDVCLILFNDRDMDAWLENGQITAPNTSRLHSFSDAIIFSGISSLNAVLDNYDPDNLELINDASKLSIAPTEINLTATDKIQFQNGNSIISLGPSLIKIANDSQNLKTLLTSLISTIKSMTINVVPGSFASPDGPVTGLATGTVATGDQSSLSSISSSLGELLE
jgi:hypothetical protein